MDAKFRITFDGDGEHVRDGRLSLALFLEPLRLLLDAYRRTAAGIVKQAGGEGDGYTSKAVPAAANALDLEIIKVESGSIGLGLNPRQMPRSSMRARRVEDLDDVAAARLLEDIDAERRGQARNKAVREYLGSLPKEVKRQSYVLRRADGTDLAIEFDEMQLMTLPTPTVRAALIHGSLTAVGFEKNKEFVEVASEGQSIRLKCTAAQADDAVRLRVGVITCAYIEPVGAPKRVLWLRSNSERWRPSEDDLSSAISARWAGVFERLAR